MKNSSNRFVITISAIALVISLILIVGTKANIFNKTSYALEDNHTITIKKETKDNKQGEFTYRVKAWKEEKLVSSYDYEPILYSYGESSDISYSWEVDIYEDFIYDGVNFQQKTYHIKYKDGLMYGANAVYWVEAPLTSDWIEGDLQIVPFLKTFIYHVDENKTIVNEKSYNKTDLGAIITIRGNKYSVVADGYGDRGNHEYTLYVQMPRYENLISYLDLSSQLGNPVGENTYSFKLKNGQSIDIEVPDGYQYEIEEQTQDGWQLVSINDNTSLTKVADTSTSDKTYVFKNIKTAYNITTNYYKEVGLNEDGSIKYELIDSNILPDKQNGYEYTASSLTNIPEGYELVSTPSNASGKINNSDVVVNYYYKLKDVILTVKHLEQGTNEELDVASTKTYKYNSSYETSKSNNVSSNYELVSEPSNKNGTIKADTEVIYYYKKKEATLTVKYLEYNTTTPIAEEISKKVYFGDQYEAEDPTEVPSNYILKEKTENYKGIVDKSAIEVIYYYEKKDGKILPTITKNGLDKITSLSDKVSYSINFSVEFIDLNSNAEVLLIDTLPYEIDESKSNLDGGVYKNKTITWTDTINESKEYNKNIEVVFIGLDPTIDKITNVVKGQVKVDNKTVDVENVYNTIVDIKGKITIKYVDKDGNDLVKPITVTNKVGQKYISSSKEIDGYKLTEKPKNETYIYTESEQTVVYKYEKIEVKETKKEETKNEEENKTTPKTGIGYDISNAVLIIGVATLFFSVMVLLNQILRIKREKNN